MHYSIEKIKQYLIKLTISLDKSDLNYYVFEAQKNLANDLRIRGFRKGRIPFEIAKDYLDKNEVLEVALDFALRDSLGQIILKEKFEILDSSDLKILENTKDKMVYSVILTVIPDFRLTNYKQIEIKKKKIRVGEEEVDRVLEFIRSSRAKFHKVSRALRKGDRVKINFEIFYKGEKQDIPHELIHPFIFGERDFFGGLNENLEGLKTDDYKTFWLRTDDGKELEFKAKVESIEEVEKPELNDEFAKSIGRFNNLEDLRSSIKEGLLKEKEEEESRRIQMLIINKISEKTKIEIPEILINKQLDQMIADFDADLHSKGLELSLYLARQNKTPNDLRKEWYKRAEDLVKKSLILRKIANLERIEVSSDEIEERVNLYATNFGEEQIDLKKLADYIYQILLNEKVLKFLENNAKYI